MSQWRNNYIRFTQVNVAHINKKLNTKILSQRQYKDQHHLNWYTDILLSGTWVRFKDWYLKINQCPYFMLFIHMCRALVTLTCYTISLILIIQCCADSRSYLIIDEICFLYTIYNCVFYLNFFNRINHY